MAVPSDKVEDIRRQFAPLIGQRIEQYETAELLFEGVWRAYDDLPLRLYFSSAAMASISWSRFDDLSFSDQPFSTEGLDVRWVRNGRSELNHVLGLSLRGAALGRGEMSMGGMDSDIWTRLILDLGPKWLEIYNALDENGYAVHDRCPEGDFWLCVA
jgi:hypothetical protein